MNSFGDDSVAAIEVESFRLVKNIPVGSGIGPTSITAFSSRPALLVSSRLTNSLYVIDTEELVVVASADVGHVPNDIVLSPDESVVYVANAIGEAGFGNSVTIVDTMTYQTASLGFFFNPGALAVASDGETLYVGGLGHNDVEVVDLSGVEPTYRLGIAGTASDLVISRDGRRLFARATGATRSNVSAISVDTGRIVDIAMDFPDSIAVAPQGETIFVGSDETLLSAFDSDSLSLLWEVRLGGWFSSISVSKSGDIFASYAFEDTVTKVDASSGAEVARWTVRDPGASVVAPCSFTCLGDCDGNGRVAISELLTGVRLSLGLGKRFCSGWDHDLDRVVTVNELVGAVVNALYGCLLESGGPR